jgi:hypothetical protein
MADSAERTLGGSIRESSSQEFSFFCLACLSVLERLLSWRNADVVSRQRRRN